MKRSLRLLLLYAPMIITPINKNNTTLEITIDEKDDSEVLSAINKKYIKKVILPINTPVSFTNCPNLETVTYTGSFSKNSFEFPEEAFSDCGSLKTITLPNFPQDKKFDFIISSFCFNNCYSLETINVTLPTSISYFYVGYRAFANTKNLYPNTKGKYKSLYYDNSNKKYYSAPKQAISSWNLSSEDKTYFSSDEWTTIGEDKALVPGMQGLHFCTRIHDIFNYFYNTPTIFTIETGDDIKTYADISCARKIKLTKKLDNIDILKLLLKGSA